jgi:hypothetical protein
MMARTAGPLRERIRDLTSIFRASRSKHEAHERSRDVLLEMAHNPRVFTEALIAHVREHHGLNGTNFPVVGVDIESNPYFELAANCFLPHSGGRTDLTWNSVHHHGHLLLTTVTAFGPGYEHWRFTQPKLLDPERDLFTISVIDRKAHGPNDAAFVDAYMPHAVMYPQSLSVTFALWSSEGPVTWRDRAKRLPFVKGREDVFRRIASHLGISRSLGINVIRYFDYFPCDGGFKGMRERVQFQRGPNEDYLHSFFHVLQRTGNESVAAAISHQLSRPGELRNPAVVAALLKRLRAGVPIDSQLSKGVHEPMPHMNFPAAAIEHAVAGSAATLDPATATS